jgi:hypothetical protein
MVNGYRKDSGRKQSMMSTPMDICLPSGRSGYPNFKSAAAAYGLLGMLSVPRGKAFDKKYRLQLKNDSSTKVCELRTAVCPGLNYTSRNYYSLVSQEYWPHHIPPHDFPAFFEKQIHKARSTHSIHQILNHESKSRYYGMTPI